MEKDRDSKVIDLWLQCYNNSEIEKLTDVSDDTVKRIIEKLKDSQNGKDAEMRNFTPHGTVVNIIEKVKNGKIANIDNFTPQLYNIWNFVRNNNETFSGFLQ